MIKDIKDIAYIAGFFDGEGWIGYGFNFRKEIRIVNKNREVLEYIQKLYGGHIYQRKQPKNPRHSIAYDLVILRKEEVAEFIRDVLPFLIVTKEKVNTIVNYQI